MTFTLSERYSPRPIRFRELREFAGWRLKFYDILHGEQRMDWPVFEEGLRLALPELPLPAVTRDRPGLGFVIAHQGRAAFYLVLGWWANENEYYHRLFVRSFGPDTWHPTMDGETACVWELQVIGFERAAYVSAILSQPEQPDSAAYLAQRLNIGCS